MARAATRSPASPKPSDDTRRILATLSTQHPNADTELHFSNAYELLVATILSAQCTDERVNQVTPALFTRYPDARALARATTDELEPQIQSTGFFRAKSRSLVGMATAVVADHGGEIPRTMDDLVRLPGVGRKTANVVLGHALGVPGLPVDRHVLRVANRIGIARSEDPAIVEQQLGKALPDADWTRASDTLILHGRRICKPRPLCDRCSVRDACDYYHATLGARPGRTGRASRESRAAKPRVTGRARGAPKASLTRGHASRESRAAKPQVTGRGGGALKESLTRGQASRESRAAKPQGTGREGGAPKASLTRGHPSRESRAAKPRGTTGRGGEAVKASLTRGHPSRESRAAKPRGTGRGGGAPRQSKK